MRRPRWPGRAAILTLQGLVPLPGQEDLVTSDPVRQVCDVCTTIFYGHGLGLFGSVARWQQALIVATVWVVQLWWSPVRFRRFGRGHWNGCGGASPTGSRQAEPRGRAWRLPEV